VVFAGVFETSFGVGFEDKLGSDDGLAVALGGIPCVVEKDCFPLAEDDVVCVFDIIRKLASRKLWNTLVRRSTVRLGLRAYPEDAG